MYRKFGFVINKVLAVEKHAVSICLPGSRGRLVCPDISPKICKLIQRATVKHSKHLCLINKQYYAVNYAVVLSLLCSKN